MKFKLINSAITGLILVNFCLANVANAGLLKSTTGTNITQRYCPQVNADFEGYIAQWGDIMSDPEIGFPFPQDPSKITQQDACVFNTQWEHFFEGADPGDKSSLQAVQESINSTHIENVDGDIWLDAVLDNTDLSLPEAHFVVNSQESERNSVNLFSAQSFLWEGGTTMLEFSALFDFSMSTGSWGSDLDSFYILQIGASKDMTFGEGMLFPEFWGEELALGKYNSNYDFEIINEDINYRDLSISFEVNNGDEFQLWGLSQAFALNGGWVDSANTMRTQLSVEGLSVEESEQLFSNSLSVVTSVPEPSTFAIFSLGLLGLVSRRSCKGLFYLNFK